MPASPVGPCGSLPAAGVYKTSGAVAKLDAKLARGEGDCMALLGPTPGIMYDRWSTEVGEADGWPQNLDRVPARHAARLKGLQAPSYEVFPGAGPS